MATKRGLVLLLLFCFALLCCQPATTGASRDLPEFKSKKAQVIRAELIHRNHPESRLPVRSSVASASSPSARRRLADHVGVQFRTPLSAASLYGELAEYVMTIYLGTPVQKFVLMVDTGSDLVWVQCKPCIQCYNQTNPVFDPAASATYSTADCEYCDQELFYSARCIRRIRNCLINYRYNFPGSSIRGVLATENISFTNDTTQLAVSNLLFGCMDNNTASFGTLDGLVGMGRGPLSLPSQLRELTSLNAFSYCLVPFSVSSVLTSPLLFGATTTSSELVYTRILENPVALTSYWVNMTGVTVGGAAVNVSAAALEWNSTTFDSGGTIFDSGTPYTVFNEGIFTPLVQTLRGLITYPIVPAEDLCYNVSGVLQPVFPSVSFQFSGVDGGIVDFPLGAQNLFQPNSTADLAVQCLAMVPVSAQSLGPNIIGNIAQADHYIETDLDNMRIGWTSRDCSLPL